MTRALESPEEVPTYIQPPQDNFSTAALYLGALLRENGLPDPALDLIEKWASTDEVDTRPERMSAVFLSGYTRYGERGGTMLVMQEACIAASSVSGDRNIQVTDRFSVA